MHDSVFYFESWLSKCYGRNNGSPTASLNEGPTWPVQAVLELFFRAEAVAENGDVSTNFKQKLDHVCINIIYVCSKWANKLDRPDRPDRLDKLGILGRLDKLGKLERLDKLDRPYRLTKLDIRDKPCRLDRLDRLGRLGTLGRLDKLNIPD